MYRVALMFGIAFVFAAALNAGNAKTKSSPIVVEKTKLTFDPRTCTTGVGQFYWNYGSCRVEVVGHEGKDCVFRYKYEQEMSGDHVATVKVPIDSGPVVIEAKQHSEMKTIPEANTWSGVFTSFTKKRATRMQIVGRNGVEEDADRRGAAGVSLVLKEADAKRSEASVHFRCEVQLANDTGRDLTVRSSFRTAFDSLHLVITNEKGKELAQWGSSWHKSPYSPDGKVTVKKGITAGSLVFPVDSKLLDGVSTVRVRLIGTLPGSGYERTLSTETLKVEIKNK